MEFLTNLDFPLAEIRQFDKSFNLICLVHSTLDFLFPVFFLQLMQYAPLFLYRIFHNIFEFQFLLSSHYVRLTYYLLIKPLEIKTLIVYNLAFNSNTILSCFFFFFLFIDCYFLIAAVIAQTFNLPAELAVPTGTPSNKANVEIET